MYTRFRGFHTIAENLHDNVLVDDHDLLLN